LSTTPAIRGEGIFESAKDVFSRQVKARKSHEYASKKFHEVQGLGDDAFWIETALWVLKGDALFVITVNSVLEGSFKNTEAMETAHSGQNLALSKQVAATMLSRMK